MIVGLCKFEQGAQPVHDFHSLVGLIVDIVLAHAINGLYRFS
jgi:hypothetical protein